MRVALDRDRGPRPGRGHGFDVECAKGEEGIQSCGFHGGGVGDADGGAAGVFAVAGADEGVGVGDGAVEVPGGDPGGEGGVSGGEDGEGGEGEVGVGGWEVGKAVCGGDEVELGRVGGCV